VRVTSSAAGDVVVDGASMGRGAWLCRGDETVVATTCLDAALAKRAFARAWRSDVPAELERRLRVQLGG
jgi:predicted RNA-binding protein YlxR (DUF448 family)